VALVNREKLRAVFKRLETDREYRVRLHARNIGGSTLLASQITLSHGSSLDSIGEQLLCLRRIVEDAQ